MCTYNCICANTSISGYIWVYTISVCIYGAEIKTSLAKLTANGSQQ